MQVMFSAAENNDEELTQQVADDIEATKTAEMGEGVADDEVSYINLGSGKVLIIDQEAGEATVAEQNAEDPEQYDLEGFDSEEELEKYLHTLEDGVTPDENVQTEVTESVEDHMDGNSVVSPNLEDGGLNPQAGCEPTVEETACGEEEGEETCPECGCDPCECEGEEEEREYSVTMTEEELCMFSDYLDSLVEESNMACVKVFSDPEFYAHLFSEVLEEDEPAHVGGLTIEKADDDTIIVTDAETGDEAQITVDENDEFVVSEVQKEFEDEEREYSVTMTEDELRTFSDYLESLYSDLEEDEEGPEQFEPVYVVGIDPVNHVIVDSPVYDEEDAQVLAQRLNEDGVEALQIFENPDEAREYAVGLLGDAGVSEIEQIAEPEEHAFSDVTIYTTRYFSDCSNYMLRLFSEAEEDITDSQDDIEQAIENSEQIENENEIITPIDNTTAVVHDKENDEYTKVTLVDDELNTEMISEEEADELTKDIEEVEDEAEEEAPVEEETKEFSTVEKFFADVLPVDPAMAAAPAPVQAVNPEEINPETGDPIAIEPTAVPVQSVESVEDKALAAVQSIQEAANEAVLAITEAKEAPAPGEEQDLREAQFSHLEDPNDTLAGWFASI